MSARKIYRPWVNKALQELRLVRTMKKIKPLADKMKGVYSWMNSTLKVTLSSKSIFFGAVSVSKGEENLGLNKFSEFLLSVKKEGVMSADFNSPVASALQNTIRLKFDLMNEGITDSMSAVEYIPHLLSFSKNLYFDIYSASKITRTLLKNSGNPKEIFTLALGVLRNEFGTVDTILASEFLFKLTEYLSIAELQDLSILPVDYNYILTRMANCGVSLNIIGRKLKSNNLYPKEKAKLMRKRLNILRTKYALLFIQSKLELQRQSELSKDEELFIKKQVHLYYLNSILNSCSEKAEKLEPEKAFPKIHEYLEKLEVLENRVNGEGLLERYSPRIENATANTIDAVAEEIEKDLEEILVLKKKLIEEWGIPESSVNSLLNHGFREETAIVQEYIDRVGPSPAKKGKQSKKSTIVPVVRAPAEPKEQKLSEEVVDSIREAIITAKLVNRNGSARLESILLSKYRSELNNFIRVYIQYLAEPEGERGIFAEGGTPSNSQFKEKHKLKSVNSNGWRFFSLQHAKSRIVFCVRPEGNEIFLLAVETEHEKYSNLLATFDSSAISKKVIIEITNEKIVSRTINGNQIT